ncbi:transcriptional regulator family: Fungal Specific TF [Penicillium taxi]|uniref:transcriptional regulator family: Fungal Specific TF n=1 Tax=Penicillium taxi TaxID=168475 RepID=UPI002545919B|nr:transcriptional regulator family: Fungal Specific TF [Penicillium taxi]KAJ5894286.1 transcriptional regulator family: Fungal Specific TF [Penicillium taxi]
MPDYPRKRALVAWLGNANVTVSLNVHTALAKDVSVNIQKARTRSKDTPDKILRRLSRLEALVQQQTEAISALTEHFKREPRLDAPLSQTSLAIFANSRGLSAPVNSSQAILLGDIPRAVSSWQRYDYSDNETSLIPLGHQTPTGNLLGLEGIKSLIGDYPPGFFLMLESERKLPPLVPRTSYNSIIQRLNLYRDITDSLVASFFTHVHSTFPILDHGDFMETFERFLVGTHEPDLSSALCLTVLALGDLCSQTEDPYDTESIKNGQSTEYFAHAYQVLSSEGAATFSRELVVPLAFFYASLYFRYRARPLQAWKLVNTASTGVQLMFSYLHDATISLKHHQILFHFPRSQIEVLVDGLPFPEFTDPNDRDNLKFLAMCSIRKLFNRIHNTLYPNKPAEPNGSPFNDTRNSYSPRPPTTPVEAVNVELNRQLEVWFDSLPDQIKPDLLDTNPQSTQDNQLRLRYYSARHIISRPFLVYAAQSDGDQLSPLIKSNCETCVDSCRNFVIATVPFLRKRTHSTWLRFQALLAAVFVLSLARTTPSLSSLIPDFDDLIEHVILCTEPWARHLDTVDAILGIFKTIQRKSRISFLAS